MHKELKWCMDLAQGFQPTGNFTQNARQFKVFSACKEPNTLLLHEAAG